MMPLERHEIMDWLERFRGTTVYLHVEVTPGAFVRNAKTDIAAVHAAGDGPFRVALELPDRGWIRVEGLTHGLLDEQGRLLLAGHDELGRLTTALQLSREPFPA